MAEPKVSILITARDAASRVLQRLDKSMDRVGRTGTRMSRVVRAAGFSLGSLGLLSFGPIGVIGLLTTAMLGAGKAAAAEEKNIARLDQALKNNVKGYNGNRDAIEKVIDGRQRLGFADDKLRDSLGQLVTRTHNVKKAFDLQSIAMDLARQRNMDLETATLIVGKVYGGNVGILTRYGIAMKKGATSTEALAILQKMGAGQAEAYGKTTAAAWSRFQIAMGNLIEDIGIAALPVLTHLAEWLTGTLVPAIRTVFGNIQKWVSDNRVLINTIVTLVGGALSLWVNILQRIIGFIGGVVHAIQNSKPAMRLLGALADAIAGSFRNAARAVQAVIDTISNLLGAISRAQGALNSLTGGSGHHDPIGDWLSGGRQHGGPVLPGGRYTVGEAGPETLVMGRRGGYVVPHGGGGSLRPVVIQLVMDGRVVADLVDKRLGLRLATAAGTSRNV
jgi:hypothetical protein